ncbi:hypothetical protein MHBO_002868, partial [Bonamia ostreae]
PKNSNQKNLFSCSFCSKKFARAPNFQKHLNSHQNIPQCHPCWYCQKGFSRKCVLVRHVKEVHQFDDKNRVRCPKCSKSFKFKTSLSNHLKIHNDEIFKCAVCGKVFKCKRYLNTHMQRHGESMHACKVCGKMFAAHVDVLKHNKVHRENFRCAKCKVVFKEMAGKIVHCCSESKKRKFRISDEMASDFVKTVRNAALNGRKYSVDEAMRLMSQTIPSSLCTEHILFSLSSRFDLKFYDLRKNNCPPPPPPSKSNLVKMGENATFEKSSFPATKTSLVIPKTALPEKSKVHWYLRLEDENKISTEIEMQTREVIEMIKESADKGFDNIKLIFNAENETKLMIAITKSMEEKGFKCWNCREIENERQSQYYSLNIEWGHLSASH